MSEVLLRLVSELVLPPIGPFVLLATAFGLRLRQPRSSIVLALLACAWIGVFSLPGTYRWLRNPWPEHPSNISMPYPPAEAIVVLGGGRYLDAPEYGGDTAGPSTLERLRYGAKIGRETKLPILVSGGKPGDFGTLAEATVMKDILEHEYGLPVRWVEAESRNTRSNAELSVPILKADGIQSIYLVTHETHMARARKEFESRGLRVVPMPTGFEHPDKDSVYLWIPSFYGLSLCRAWLYEKLAPLNPF